VASLSHNINSNSVNENTQMIVSEQPKLHDKSQLQLDGHLFTKHVADNNNNKK